MISATIGLTAHNEGLLCGTTLKSINFARDIAEKENIKVNYLLCVDRGDNDTYDFFNNIKDKFESIYFTDFGDQGLARNFIAEKTKTEFLGFMDLDDLCSSNWILNSVHLLSKFPNEKIIVHPELNWFFGNQNSILLNLDEDSVLFDKLYYFNYNHYDALCFSKTDAWKEVPYAIRDLKNGFAYEDWQWNIETSLKGWKHKIASDTIIFKRRRSLSQTIKASSQATSHRLTNLKEYFG